MQPELAAYIFAQFERDDLYKMMAAKWKDDPNSYINTPLAPMINAALNGDAHAINETKDFLMSFSYNRAIKMLQDGTPDLNLRYILKHGHAPETSIWRGMLKGFLGSAKQHALPEALAFAKKHMKPR